MHRAAYYLLAALSLLLACSGADEEDAPDEGTAVASPDDADDAVGEGREDGPDDADAEEPADDEPVDHVPPPPGSIPVRLEAVATGLHVPNDLAELGDGRLLINDQAGAIYLLTADGLTETPVLDLSQRILAPEGSGGRLELGLSGIAVHPRFSDNGKLYALFTEPPPDDADRVARVDVLSEFTASGDPLTVDPASERELLRIDQIARDHVGGHLAFDDEGLLYVGLGDGGVGDEAADPTTLRGSVLRIDPDGGDEATPYAIPDDNPFVNGGGAPEVFAYGFRNPWRVTWLEGSGIVVADPKFTSKDQDVHVLRAGNDHGWPRLPRGLSGGSCYPDDASEPVDACVEGPAGESWTAPVVEFGDDVGRIVSGIAPYNGPIEELAGRVLVSDWQGALLAAQPGSPDERWPTERVHATLPDGNLIAGHYLWSLDHDSTGEAYVFTARLGFPEGDGAVYRIVAAD